MSKGIYIHIPFCRKACCYCDFHFSTNTTLKKPLVASILKEIVLRKNEGKTSIQSIYFGGGTPSILLISEIEEILNTIVKNFDVLPSAEITIEANPENLDKLYTKGLKMLGFNRISIGIQSFNNEDLIFMNRSHSAKESFNAIENAQSFFQNISIDLIYGIPGMDEYKWKNNLETFIKYRIPHLSAYLLTVEPKTLLANKVAKQQVRIPKETIAERHFLMLLEIMDKHKYIAYETSSFGKEGFFSRANTAYWLGSPYLGIGPAAHSYDSFEERKINISNNHKYIQEIQSGQLPTETEQLTLNDKFNEYLMTRLRTFWGCSLEEVTIKYGVFYYEHLKTSTKKFIDKGLMEIKDSDTLVITKKGKFLSDGITSDLFVV